MVARPLPFCPEKLNMAAGPRRKGWKQPKSKVRERQVFPQVFLSPTGSQVFPQALMRNLSCTSAI